MNMQNLYIISGCNGAGKTTASYTILPELLDCREFVNADEIAEGLLPFQPEKMAIEAGRIMLVRIDELLCKKEDFAFETTLATKSYVQTIKRAKESGCQVTLFINIFLIFFPTCKFTCSKNPLSRLTKQPRGFENMKKEKNF